MSQPLAQAFANVRDDPYHAEGDGDVDDTAAIQRAIDSGLHVLFPRGNWASVSDDTPAGSHMEVRPYRVTGVLNFNHDGQRCIFLAGASLLLDDDRAGVTITGKSQTFSGLRISTGTDVAGLHAGFYTPPNHPARPDPCLLIDGADGLLLEDVRVSCGAATTLVRIQNTDGICIQGGAIDGVAEAELNTGLSFGNEVRDFEAVGLAINQLGHGVVFEGLAERISFLGGTDENNTQNMIEVRKRAEVHGLSLIGMHMECNTDNGALHFVDVLRGGGVYGGVFAACLFGGLRPIPQDEVNSIPRRVFVIAGEWHGVEVSGCLHYGNKDAGEVHAIWEIEVTASVSRSCDMFNEWYDVLGVATGPKAAAMPILTSEFGAMTLTADEIQIEASKIGFFGATPTARGPAYSVGANVSRNVTSGSTYALLGALLRDLANLGLIECNVGSSPWPP